MSMQAKRDTLVAWLTSLLQGFDATYKVEDRFRTATFQASSRMEQSNIMGDPARYAEVTYRGSGREVGDAYGTDELTSHRFVISVWHQLKDADTYAASSQSVFDNIVEGDAGLFAQLRTSGVIAASGDTYSYGIVGRPSVTESFLDKDTYAHFAQITVDLYD